MRDLEKQVTFSEITPSIYGYIPRYIKNTTHKDAGNPGCSRRKVVTRGIKKM
jgi:hypothetical protein